MRPVPGPVLAGRGILLRALTRVLGGERMASDWLAETLEDAGMHAVPEGRDAFEAFVREEVLPRLMPTVRLDQLHDLVRRTIGEEGSLHPPPLRPYGGAPGATVVKSDPSRRPRVVVVEADSFRRIALSRELVRGGFDVEVVASARDVLGVDAFHALVIAVDEEGEKVVRELARRRTRAGLVTWDDPSQRGALKRVIDEWPSDRVALVARDAAPATLASRVRIVLA